MILFFIVLLFVFTFISISVYINVWLVQQGAPGINSRSSPQSVAATDPSVVTSNTFARRPQVQLESPEAVDASDVQEYIDLVTDRINRIGSVIATNKDNDSKDDDRLVIKVEEHDTEEAQELQAETEVPPITITKKKPTPPKSSGFLGFLLGGLMIIAGAALALCAGPLVACFGMKMIMDGVRLIDMNIQMNANGTYDAKQIVGSALETTYKNVLLFGLAAADSAGPRLRRRS